MLFLVVLVFGSSKGAAQDSQKTNWEWAGYVETYYSFDFNQPANNNRSAWFYNHRRSNEVAVNLALLQLKVTGKNYRAALGLMAGTYAQHNLAHEPNALQNIYEANAGVAINKKNNLWLEAGIFESHIGFESPIGADCYNVTRGLLAEGSPYYVSGARLSYEPTGKWTMALYALNG